jgi:fructokinase
VGRPEHTPGPARLVVFGEALTDFIREDAGRWTAAAGGSCWNVARCAARLGLPTGFAGAVSRDPFGDELLRLAGEAGLDLRYTQQLDRSPLLAMVTSRDPPTYFFVGDDSADLHFDAGALPAGWLEGAELAHFGGISLARPPLAGRLVALAERLHAAGKRIAYDPNFRTLMRQGYDPTLRRMAAIADHLKVSDEDLAGLFPGRTPETALRELRALAPRADVLLTLGAGGMRLLTSEGELFQPALRVEVADTVGAGDASMGGWLASLLLRPEAPLARHLAFAAGAAAAACQRRGAHAPTWAEVEALLARGG